MLASSLAEFIPQNQFIPESVSPLPCLPALVCHTLLIVYFFKELISFIIFLDKGHTSVFKALILSVFELSWTVIPQIPQLFTAQSRLLRTLKEMPFENTVGKEKVLVTSIFSFPHNVFYPIHNKFPFFSQI